MAQSQIKVSAITAFSDNYIWLISSSKTDEISLVDPGDANVCIDYIKKHNLKLSSILITHHHADHVGGVTKLAKYCQQRDWPLTVYGPAQESIPARDIALSNGNQVELSALETQFSIIDLPGHTSGHIAYYNQNEDILFCGDTLFSAGCGRLFEGTPKQMHTSLKKLAALPERTKVYCAHEYTLANLNFALAVEPDNEELIHYYNQVTQLRHKGKASIPSSIAREKHINPFLRSHISQVQQSAREYAKQTNINELDAFTILRRWKDTF